MHFPIIVIEEAYTKKADFIDTIDYEDGTLNHYTDYYGEEYTSEERKNVIKSKWLKELFSGIATIDVKRETITFLDADTIKATICQYMVDLTKRLHEQAENGEMSCFQFRWAGVEYKGCSAMFYKGCGFTSFQFIEDAPYYAGQTYKFGNIFDAHF